METDGLDYARLSAALGTDTMGTRLANALYREGILSIAALAQLADAIGMDALHSRITSISGIGTGCWDRLDAVLVAYRRGPRDDPATPVRTVHAFMLRGLAASRAVPVGIYDRLRDTAGNITALPGDEPLINGNATGMTVDDLRTVIRLIAGHVH